MTQYIFEMLTRFIVIRRKWHAQLRQWLWIRWGRFRQVRQAISVRRRDPEFRGQLREEQS